MNILIVTQYFWPENFRINDLALGLIERKHKVTVLTGMPNYPEGHFYSGFSFFGPFRQNYQGIKIWRVPLLPRGKGGKFRLALNYISFAFFASISAPFLCRGEFDLIFVFEPSPITVGLPALVIKKFRSIPILFWVQDLWPDSLFATGAVRSKKILKWVERLVRFIYHRCDKILCSSRAFIPSITKICGDSKHIFYFPQSVEIFYKPLDINADVPEDIVLPTGFRIMFAGNIGVAQSFDTIFAAAEKLMGYPDIHWIIIGEGRMRAWAEAQVRIRKLEKSVHFFGKYPSEAMPTFFALSDVLLVTLKRDPIFALTIPAKIQSYLACSKPIIAVLDGEGARIIDEAKAGISCPAEDAHALATAVLKMYHLPKNVREKQGESGRIYYEENFERNTLMDRLEGWMEELISMGQQKTVRLV